jgi:uncharacterized membrane protein YfcA
LIFQYWYYPLLFLTAFFAGLVDSIAGGGGIITLPVMLSLGFPPHIALGTNKFQASFGSFTASYYYIKKDVVILKECLAGIIYTLIGAAIGTWAVQQVSSDILKYIIPFLLVGIIIYSFVKTNLGEIDNRARMNENIFYLIAGLTFGFYDGFFGPGVGSFWAIAFVVGLGYNLKKATGYTKVMNFTSNVVSLVIFIIGGYVIFTAGIVMAVGQIAGSKIGAELVIKRGAKFIRPIFITIVILTTMKIIYSLLFP